MSENARFEKSMSPEEQDVQREERERAERLGDKHDACPKCGADCVVTPGSDPFTFHYEAARSSIAAPKPEAPDWSKYGPVAGGKPLRVFDLAYAWSKGCNDQWEVISARSAMVPKNIENIVHMLDELEDKGNGWNSRLYPNQANDAETKFRDMLAANWTAIRRVIPVARADDGAEKA